MTAPTRLTRSCGFFSSIATHWIALGLFFVTLALRLPFTSQTLNHWDSVNHALALSTFNVAAHRPQPPGYILYVGAARLVNFAFPDPQTALVTVSILASALAVAFLFLLGTRMASREVGLGAALLLLTSPSFWFDGEVALPYVVEGCAGVVLAYLAYRLLEGQARFGPLTAVTFAIAVGMRQQLALFFAPLILYVFWNCRWRVRLEAAAWFAVVCALWFLPLVWSAGGIGPYFTALRNLNTAFSSEFALLGTGGEAGFVRNALRIGAYTLYALNAAVVPLLFGAVLLIRRVWGEFRARHEPGSGSGLAASRKTGDLASQESVPFPLSDRRILFLALWILPSVIFYLFFHMGSPGLIYVYLTALYLLAALALRALTRGNLKWLVAGTAFALALNLLLFFGTPPDLYTGRDLRVLNYSSLREHDRSLGGRVEAIRTRFDPATTLILAATDWRFAEYYLPAYTIDVFFPQGRTPLLLVRNKQEYYLLPNDSRAQLENVKTIVLFDPNAAAFYHGTEAPQCPVRIESACLNVIDVEGRQLTIERNGVTVGDP